MKGIVAAALMLSHVNGVVSQTSEADSRRAQPVSAIIDTAQIDLNQFAASIIKGERTDHERAVRLLDWLSHNFKWLATDYKQRTVKEVIDRRGGDCFELATVYMALIKTLGIKYRQIAEINIQPESERRQENAEALIAKRGFSASVFGARHNDHRWVEIYDDKSGEWIPADPSVGVIGLEPWLKSRVWFGKRWAIDTSITNEMIVPFAVFTTDSTRSMLEDRTSYYLVTSLNRLYGGRLSTLPSWGEWVRELEAIGDKCRGAFDGRTNLHLYRAEIARLASTYAKLRKEFENRTEMR
jgi:hypothetical protein